MRVFLTTDCVGGVWRYSLDLATDLAGRGWTVCIGIVGPDPDPEQLRELMESGCDWICPGIPLDWQSGGEAPLAAGRRQLIEAAVAWGADLVHLNQPAYGGRDWPVPVVLVVHSCLESWWRAVRGTPPPEGARWHGRAVAEALRTASARLAPSAAFARQLAECYPGSPPVAALHNGLPPRAPAPASAKEAIILGAGRLWDEAKNLERLARIAPVLPWPVTLAGPLAEPGHAPRSLPTVRLAGSLTRAEMSALQARAGIFVSPSVYEPFGLAVLEAAQAGAALALADVPVFRELWENAAIFFDPRSTEDLREKLTMLTDDPARRTGLSAAALRRSTAYRLSSMRSVLEDLYRAHGAPAARAAGDA